MSTVSGLGRSLEGVLIVRETNSSISYAAVYVPVCAAISSSVGFGRRSPSKMVAT